MTIDPARDQCGFVWIGPVVPFTAKDVLNALNISKSIFARREFDFFVEVIVESPRSIIILAGVFYDHGNSAEAERAKAWYREMHDAFLQNGYPTYRATTMSMPRALDQNPVAKQFLASLKHAVDPQNMIAPGRYGTPPRD